MPPSSATWLRQGRSPAHPVFMTEGPDFYYPHRARWLVRRRAFTESVQCPPGECSEHRFFVMFRTNAFSIEDESIRAYFVAMSHFCPFLSPAGKGGVLYFSSYPLTGIELTQAQRLLFHRAVLHAELVRLERSLEPDRRRAVLISDNLLVAPADAHDGKSLLEWPHWLLKLLYTEVGLLFGKFWVGEEDISRSGDKIPGPPAHFLTIRSAFKPVDSRFFTASADLTPVYLESEDRGQDALAKVNASEAATQVWKSVIDDLRTTRLSGSLNEGIMISLAERLDRCMYYDEVLAWANACHSV